MLHRIFTGHICSLLFSNSPPRLLTKTEHRVNIHPKSVNADERVLPSPWFVYHLKLKTAQVYFHSILSYSVCDVLVVGCPAVVTSYYVITHANGCRGSSVFSGICVSVCLSVF